MLDVEHPPAEGDRSPFVPILAGKNLATVVILVASRVSRLFLDQPQYDGTELGARAARLQQLIADAQNKPKRPIGVDRPAIGLEHRQGRQRPIEQVRQGGAYCPRGNRQNAGKLVEIDRRFAAGHGRQHALLIAVHLSLPLKLPPPRPVAETWSIASMKALWRDQ